MYEYKLAVGVAAVVAVLSATVLAYFSLSYFPSTTTTNMVTGKTMVSKPSATCLSQPITSNGNTTAIPSSQINLGHPILVDVYLNGSIISGIIDFKVKPEGQSIINITTTYPWASYPSISKQACIPISFEIYSFPANRNTTSIPDWLHISFASQSLAMAYGQSASTDLLIAVDSNKMTPAQQAGGASASFDLGIHYIDPASGISVTEYSAINIIV